MSNRYRALETRSDIIDQTALFETKYGKSPIRSQVGLRLSESRWEISHFDYMLQVNALLFGFVRPSVRLFHGNQLEERASTSQLMGRLRVERWVFSWLELFASFGYYKRWTELTDPRLLPVYFNSDFSDHNFIAEIGFALKPFHELRIALWTATFDDLEVFNLNHPYVQLQFDLQKYGQPVCLSLFGRYRVLLGFGRLGEAMLGLGLRFPFRATPPRAKRS